MVLLISEAVVNEIMAVVVAVTMDDDETVTVITSILLGDVEPVVRLYITLPAGMRKGAELPRVETLHWFDDISKSPQQKCKPSPTA